MEAWWEVGSAGRMEAWWEIGSAGRMEAWWEVGSAGRMEAWWEIGFAGRMAPKAPGGVADWCCGCDIRRSAEALKRRSAEAPKRRSAEAPKRRSAEAPDRQHSGAPTGDHLPGRSHLQFAPHSVAPTSSNGLCGSRIGSRAWGHGWEIGSAGRMAPQAPGKPGLPRHLTHASAVIWLGVRPLGPTTPAPAGAAPPRGAGGRRRRAGAPGGGRAPRPAPVGG